MTKVKILQENGVSIIPVAHTESTFDNNGKSVEVKFSEINLKLNSKLDSLNHIFTDNNYTTIEKDKLFGIENNANNYSHPVYHNPSIIMQDSNNRFVSDTEKAIWNSKPIINDLISNRYNLYSSEKVNELLSNKSNISHTHNKNDIVGFPILSTVATSGNYNDLINLPSISVSDVNKNYVDSQDTYILNSAKSYADSKIDELNNFTIEIVLELPVVGESNKVYLINNMVAQDNLYTEYVWINSKWEVWGSASIDLSYYATKLDLNNKVDKVEGKSLTTNDLTNSLKTNYDKAYSHSLATHFDGNFNNLKNIPSSFSPSSHSHFSTELHDPLYTKGYVPNTIKPFFETFRGNSLAFLPAEQIIIEKSIDGGITWSDAEVSDDKKINFFSGIYTVIQMPKLNDAQSTLCCIRITITAMRYNVPVNTPETEKFNFWTSENYVASERYITFDNLYFWANSVNNLISCEIEASKGSSPSTWETQCSGYLYGWSGGSYIKGASKTFGGNRTQLANYWNYRITFRTCSKQHTYIDSDLEQSSNTSNSMSVHNMYLSSNNIWISNNNFIKNGHLYKWDHNQIATFPNSISSPGCIISTIPNGNPPLIISSSSKVLNLNADMLDGKHSTEFASSFHSHAKSEISDLPLIIDNSLSTSATDVLSANQGRVLNKKTEDIRLLNCADRVNYESHARYLLASNTNNGQIENLFLQGMTSINLCKNKAKLYNSIYIYSVDEVDLNRLKTNTLYTVVVLDESYKVDNVSFTTLQANYSFFVNEKSNVIKFTTPQSIDVTKRMSIIAYSTLENRFTSGDENKIRYMLLEGDHTQNIPGYFEELSSVGDELGKIEVLSRNEDANLFDGTPALIKGTEFVGGNLIPIETGQIYSMYYDEPINIRMIFFDASMQLIDYKYTTSTVLPVNILESVAGVRFYCNVMNGIYTNNPSVCETFKITDTRVKYIKVVKGENDIKLPYLVKGMPPAILKPHKSSKKQILFYDNENKIISLNNLKSTSYVFDEISKKSGEYYYTKRCDEIVVDGKENISFYSHASIPEDMIGFCLLTPQTKNCYYYSSGEKNVGKSNNGFVNGLFATISNTSNISYTIHPNGFIYLTMPKSFGILTLEQYKQSLQENPITIVYQLLEPIRYRCVNLDLDSYLNETSVVCNCGAIVPKMSFDTASHIANTVQVLKERVSDNEDISLIHANSINNILNNITTVSVKDFGAVGDGITDDTDAIQKAISNQNTIICFETGKKYIVSKSLNLKHSSVIEGNRSTIVLKTYLNAPFINVAHRCRIENINIVLERDAFENEHSVIEINSEYLKQTYDEANDKFSYTSLFDIFVDKVNIYKYNHGVLNGSALNIEATGKGYSGWNINILNCNFLGHFDKAIKIQVIQKYTDGISDIVIPWMNDIKISNCKIAYAKNGFFINNENRTNSVANAPIGPEALNIIGCSMQGATYSEYFAEINGGNRIRFDYCEPWDWHVVENPLCNNKPYKIHNNGKVEWITINRGDVFSEGDNLAVPVKKITPTSHSPLDIAHTLYNVTGNGENGAFTLGQLYSLVPGTYHLDDNGTKGKLLGLDKNVIYGGVLTVLNSFKGSKTFIVTTSTIKTSDGTPSPANEKDVYFMCIPIHNLKKSNNISNVTVNSNHWIKLSEFTYNLPIASATVLGGVKIGTGLSISNGVLNATGGGVADSVNWNNVTNKPMFYSAAPHSHPNYASTSHNHDSAYASKANEHMHSNSDIISAISSSDINNWNNKSNFSGDYNDLVNKPINSTNAETVDNFHIWAGTQAEYDAIPVKDNKTLYFIKE